MATPIAVLTLPARLHCASLRGRARFAADGTLALGRADLQLGERLMLWAGAIRCGPISFDGYLSLLSLPSRCASRGTALRPHARKALLLAASETLSRSVRSRACGPIPGEPRWLPSFSIDSRERPAWVMLADRCFSGFCSCWPSKC